MFNSSLLLGFQIGIIALSAIVTILAGLFVLYCGLCIVRGFIKGFSKSRD